MTAPMTRAAASNTPNNYNIINEFLNAITAAGIRFADTARIVADGTLRRVQTADDRRGQLSGWYRLHADHPPSGAAGDWRKGISTRWTAARAHAMSAADIAILAERARREQAERIAELAERHRRAAILAESQLAQSKPAKLSHNYLILKKIKPGIARQFGDFLILPILGIDGALRGAQLIDEDGAKRFTAGMQKVGGFIPTQYLPDGTQPLYIAEGWATAATIAAMRPNVCVIAGLDAGNLASVATAARQKFPNLEIVIVPDFDTVGRTAGRKAAEAARAKILPMPANVPDGCTDWNDYVGVANHV